MSIVVVDVKFVFIVAVFADEVPAAAAAVVVVVANPAVEEAEVVGIQVLIKFLT